MYNSGIDGDKSVILSPIAMQLKQVVTESDNSDLVRISEQLKVFIYISFDRMKSTMKQQVNKYVHKNMSNFSSRQGIYVDTIETCDDCN